jgi:hypothetical protein
MAAPVYSVRRQAMDRWNRGMNKLIRASVLLTTGLLLAGCGAVAAPCRVASAVIDIIPVVGHTAATPTDACADAIDPDPK